MCAMYNPVHVPAAQHSYVCDVDRLCVCLIAYVSFPLLLLYLYVPGLATLVVDCACKALLFSTISDPSCTTVPVGGWCTEPQSTVRSAVDAREQTNCSRSTPVL